MCRWFAYISPREPCLLSDVLISPQNSVFRQCSEHYLPGLLPHGGERKLYDSPDILIRLRNSLLNMDGLGIVWYNDTMAQYDCDISETDSLRPVVYKSSSPPFNDFNIKGLCQNTETKCLFAHIRASSGGSVSQANCHPFVFGRQAFMHNGVVSHIADIRIKILTLLSYDSYLNIQGVTDSELIAALYITNLTNHGAKDTWNKNYSVTSMTKAMILTVIQIMQLQDEFIGNKRWPNSLNFCATDGIKLIAIRFRNSKDPKSNPPSLYWSQTAGRSLNGKYPGHPNGKHLVNDRATKGINDEIGKHIIVSSEPTTYDEDQWHLIGKNSVLYVDEHGQKTEFPIEYDERLDVDEPEWHF